MRKKEDAERIRMDYEANVFAVCLLMPEERLLEELDKDGGLDLGGDDKRLKEICNIFGVSQQALLFRLSLMKK